MNIRTTPTVDALIIVTHNAKVATIFGEELDQGILGIVGVLIFIDMHIRKTMTIAFQHVWMLQKEGEGANEQVVKIKRIGLFEAHFIGRIQIVHLLCLQVFGGLIKPFIGREQFVFCTADSGFDFSRGEGFVIDVKLFDQFLDDTLLIVIVIDGKGTRVAEFFDIPTQDLGTHGVKGAHPNVIAFFAHQLTDTFTHFFGSFIGKGDR